MGMMSDQEKQALEKLLRDLCSAQDDVTHYNEAGQTEHCQAAQARRDAITAHIIAVVEAWT
jgi:ABC-type iron transport system FetAB permease component